MMAIAMALVSGMTISDAPPGFKDWSGACPEELLLAQGAWSCESSDSSYERERCKEFQRRQRKARALYRIPSAFRTVTYNARRKEFSITVYSLLAGTVEHEDCWESGCDAHTISASRLQAPKGKRKRSAWTKFFDKHFKQLLRPVATVRVKASKLLVPAAFEENLVVEALVEVKGSQRVPVTSRNYRDDVVGYDVSNIQVSVVGLRMRADTETFSKVVKPGRKVSPDHCEELIARGYD